MGEALPIVGVIGTGKMGAPMVQRLLAAGHRVLVFNRTASRAMPLVAAGAVATSTAGELAAAADVILTCVDTVAASDALYFGSDGILAHARMQALLVEHGTVTPELVRRVAEGAAQRGVDFVDAPVSGGPEGATHGTLAIMVGGSASAFARLKRVAQAYGRTIVHMGGAGAGTHAKLVNQLLTFVHGAAAAEAIALAQRAGLDLEALAEVLRAGFGQSRVLDRTLARVGSGDYDAGAALVLFAKDLGIVAAFGASHAVQLPVTDAARAIVADALRAGNGARDIAALHLRYGDADDAPVD